ncbi:aldo/keto reductase [Ideonella azotifigens]|uniref:Aldo/keto reductase n=1 Tax=Ideonella azotifigens TaxID=513160 RepID=A0ABN1K9F8_9BURK|nr:aldo/keto reductase [Ideonella azotifigens]MCD2339080.1 aldo/keto reductase [Ideonella azotifigens]
MTTTKQTAALPRRRLGTQGPQVSAIGLGCMGMSDFYGPRDDAQSLAVLHHALDIGLNFFDTADMYGVGRNEQLISQVLAKRRSEVVIATKFGNVRAPDGTPLGIDGSAAYVRKACDASLQRLGVEQIDLYYQHRVDKKVPIEETVGAMAELVKAGKVKHLGLSEASAATIRRAAAVHPIAAVQTEYSLWSRDVEDEVLPTCRELGIALVPYSPLGRGFLTGAIRSTDQLAADDWRRANPRFQAGNLDANLALANALGMLARDHGHTPAQLALAWLLDQGDDIVPIPGTRSSTRLDENAAATRITLDPALREQLMAVLAEHPVSGTRYPEAAMANVNV